MCRYLLSQCSTVRLHLSSHVKSVSDTYKEKKSNSKNTLIYLRNNKKSIKAYDYVIIAFPLTKSCLKQDFTLDIFYRDFLTCEMNTMHTYLIDGSLSQHNKADQVPSVIRTLSPITKQDKEHKLFLLVVPQNKHIDLKKLFNSYKLIKKTTTEKGVTPLYKKVEYTHTAFPQLIIDGKKRSRIFYLPSIEWLESSHETRVINARNIALLIAKKELSRDEVRRALNACKRFTYMRFLLKDYEMSFMPYTMFAGLVLVMISYVKFF